MSYPNRRQPAWMSAPASEGRIRFVESLLAERQSAPGFAERTRAHIDNGTLTAGMAIAAIEYLKLQNKVAGAQARRDDSVTITEPGFYLFEDEAYRVQKTKDGARLYAKKATGSGWDYAGGKGIVFKLTPDMLMTAMEIASFGGRKGFCVNCSDGLSDPISKKIGLGTKCGPDIMGNEAYRAARKHHIATDAECAAHDAQLKASAKARREAKKAQDAKEVAA